MDAPVADGCPPAHFPLAHFVEALYQAGFVVEETGPFRLAASWLVFAGKSLQVEARVMTAGAYFNLFVCTAGQPYLLVQDLYLGEAEELCWVLRRYLPVFEAQRLALQTAHLVALVECCSLAPFLTPPAS